MAGEIVTNCLEVQQRTQASNASRVLRHERAKACAPLPKHSPGTVAAEARVRI
ncbi:MAG: hypothetical protein H0T45_04335 [Pyrinomonadaceae bacterium]|nr:hypothetical protein [Pyrinomonadaceae bacterium]MDQ3133235.1 hypothetical protein [Acidobacteriota bacterium]